jgi:CPA1 family monovalent cation:H+ antiporter
MLEHYLIIAVVGVAAIVALTSVGSKLGVAPPLILILIGLGLSLIPIMGEIRVPGEVILMGVLPPLLYASAVSIPVVEFRRDLLAVGVLAVVLVVATAVVLGLALHQFLPVVPLNICIALGAIISPTDAVATTIVKRLGAPSRIVTMLDGEALLNDATALVLLRATTAGVAVSANAALPFSDIAWEFGRSAAIAALVGAVVGVIAVRVRQRLREAAATTAVSLIVPFVAFVPSEALGASGLVAVVVAGLVSNQAAPHRLPANHRMTEDAVWHTVSYLLEGAVFLAMGLQFKSLLRDAHDSGGSLQLALGLGLLCILGTIVVRTVFVSLLGLWLDRRTKRKLRRKQRWETVGDAMGVDFADPTSWEAADLIALRLAEQPAPPADRGFVGEGRRRALERIKDNRLVGQDGRRLSDDQLRQARHERMRRFPQAEKRLTAQLEGMRKRVAGYMADVDYLMRQSLGWKEGALLVWAGMRGVVTLAAAQSLTGRVPDSALLVLIAFVVAAGSMLLQGGTLGAVARALGLTGRDAAPAGECDALDHTLGEAALAALEDPELRQADGQPFDPALLAVAVMRLRITRLHDISPEGSPAAPPAEATTVDASPAVLSPVETDSADTSTADTAPAESDPTAPDDWSQSWSKARRLFAVSEDEDWADSSNRQEQDRAIRRVTLHAMREALLEARSLGTYSHKTLRDALAVLDADEIGLELRSRTDEAV